MKTVPKKIPNLPPAKESLNLLPAGDIPSSLVMSYFNSSGDIAGVIGGSRPISVGLDSIFSNRGVFIGSSEVVKKTIEACFKNPEVSRGFEIIASTSKAVGQTERGKLEIPENCAWPASGFVNAPYDLITLFTETAGRMSLVVKGATESDLLRWKKIALALVIHSASTLEKPSLFLGTFPSKDEEYKKLISQYLMIELSAGIPENVAAAIGAIQPPEGSGSRVVNAYQIFFNTKNIELAVNIADKNSATGEVVSYSIPCAGLDRVLYMKILTFIVTTRPFVLEKCTPDVIYGASPYRKPEVMDVKGPRRDCPVNTNPPMFVEPAPIRSEPVRPAPASEPAQPQTETVPTPVMVIPDALIQELEFLRYFYWTSMQQAAISGDPTTVSYHSTAFGKPEPSWDTEPTKPIKISDGCEVRVSTDGAYIRTGDSSHLILSCAGGPVLVPISTPQQKEKYLRDVRNFHSVVLRRISEEHGIDSKEYIAESEKYNSTVESIIAAPESLTEIIKEKSPPDSFGAPTLPDCYK